jgi:hypothetical protein
MMHLHHASRDFCCHAQRVASDPPPKRRRGKSIGQLMAEAAKGITPEIAPEVTQEIVAEATEQAKEAPSRLRQTLRELQAKWERTSIQFFQAPKL